MGVRFLESYMHRTASQSCQIVDIRRLIEEYKIETNKPAEILIDGMCFIRYLVKQTEWYYGGQLLELEVEMEKFVWTLKEYGADPVLFIDGTTPDYKLNEWVRRQTHKFEFSTTIFKQLENRSRVYSNELILPSNVVHVMRHTFSGYGCKIISSKLECDRCIAEYALEHGSMAIISQDTDFVVYNTSKYLSLKHCDFQNLRTVEYKTGPLIENLKIEPHHMPLLACLAGNDRISEEQLKVFHQKIGFRKKNRGADFRKLASYVSKYSPPPELFKEVEFISFDVFEDSSMTHVINEILNDYLLSPREKNCSNGNKEKSNWEIIVLACEQLVHEDKFLGFNQIHNLISMRSISLGVCLEDLSLESCNSVTAELRRRWYGILFYEYPEPLHVTENVFSGKFQKTNVLPRFPTVEHPGLEALWFSKDAVIEDLRWELICWVFEINSKSNFKKVPLKYLVPLLTAKYLFCEKAGLFNVACLDALLASSVCLEHYRSSQVKDLIIPSNSPIPEAVNMYSIITSTFSFVILILLTIGLAEIHQIKPTYYQDGKLFQIKYFDAKEGKSLWNLSEHEYNSYREVMALKSLVFG